MTVSFHLVEEALADQRKDNSDLISSLKGLLNSDFELSNFFCAVDQMVNDFDVIWNACKVCRDKAKAGLKAYYDARDDGKRRCAKCGSETKWTTEWFGFTRYVEQAAEKVWEVLPSEKNMRELLKAQAKGSNPEVSHFFSTPSQSSSS